MNAILSVRVHGEGVDGRLMFLDRPTMTPGDLILSQIVANRTASSMEYFYRMRRQQQAVVTEERLRLARDLHDSLLQSLTAANLQLQSIGRLIADEPKDARKRVRALQRLISENQQELRGLIQSLHGTTLRSLSVEVDLASRLAELRRHIEKEWGLLVDMQLKGESRRLNGAIAWELYLLINEAVVNAARHGQASEVRVDLEILNGCLQIIIADNGRGFSFQGHYDHTALSDRNLGPKSLRERVTALGGTLAIRSSQGGALLEITIPPIAKPGARDAD